MKSCSGLRSHLQQANLHLPLRRVGAAERVWFPQKHRPWQGDDDVKPPSVLYAALFVSPLAVPWKLGIPPAKPNIGSFGRDNRQYYERCRRSIKVGTKLRSLPRVNS